MLTWTVQSSYLSHNGETVVNIADNDNRIFNYYCFTTATQHLEDGFKELLSFMSQDDLEIFFESSLGLGRALNDHRPKYLPGHFTEEEIVAEVDTGTLPALSLVAFMLSRINSTRDGLVEMTENFRVNLSESRISMKYLHKNPAVFAYPSWCLNYREGGADKKSVFTDTREFVSISEDFTKKVLNCIVGPPTLDDKFSDPPKAFKAGQFLRHQDFSDYACRMWGTIERDEELRRRLDELPLYQARMFLLAMCFLGDNVRAVNSLLDYFSSDEVYTIDFTTPPNEAQRYRYNCFISSPERTCDPDVAYFLIEHDSGVMLSEENVNLVKETCYDLDNGQMLPFAWTVAEALKNDPDMPFDWVISMAADVEPIFDLQDWWSQ